MYCLKNSAGVIVYTGSCADCMATQSLENSMGNYLRMEVCP